MLKNDLKIAWRNLLKNKTFSIINIAGLAIGLSCFILIALWVLDEIGYDRFHEKADRIYRINSHIRMGGSDLKLAVASDPMGATLKKDYPQVEDYTRLYASGGSKLIKKGNEYINESNVIHADSTIFNVFTLPVLSGNAATALNEPNTVVITRSAAIKYFGNDDAIGKTLETDDNNSTLYKVTGVIEDIPENSHFHFDFIFSMDNVSYDFGNYLSHNFHTYILLKPGTDYKAFEKNFSQYINNYILPQAQHLMQIKSMDDFEKSGNTLAYTLMPLTKIHLYADSFPELSANGNVQYVYIFSAVAIFILLIACINFMNLSTARSANRAKEVGIRKVLGTGKRNLIQQFLTESTLMAIFSLLAATLIAWMVIPFFNDISNKTLTIKSLLSYRILPVLIALPIVVGILAGSYPAFFLSSFQPIQVLKGKINAGFKRNILRSSLVVFQFAISIFLIIGTIVVYKQLNYIQTTKLGFNKDQVLIINGTGALGKNASAFKNEVLNMPGVVSGSLSGYLPVSESSRSDRTYSKEAVMDGKNGFNMQTWYVDYDYVKTLGMEIISGRNFSPEFGSDSSAVVINETTAKILGYSDPVGQKLYAPDEKGGQPSVFNIIGVVKNFHYESLRQSIGPLCLALGKSTWLSSFKVKTANIQSLVKQIEDKYKTMAPSLPFSYRFLDDSFDNMYRTEQRVGKIALTFAVLTILIACLGLFGLATYMSEQRTKEIGVRKVLGATVSNIVHMLSKDFLKLVIISGVFAVPLGWWVMNIWLRDFAYRIDISWWVFGAAIGVAVLIALCTVSFQAIKAAIANPIKSLRTE